MVATRGPGWGLAPCLVDLIEETDELYPNRDHSSDGSIGDLSHQARESDHNPDDGWVCAVDIDEDLSTGLHTLINLAAHIIDVRDHRVKYLIYEGLICKSYVDSGHHPAWEWQTYTGINDHTHHLHVSVWNTDAARNDTGPWWPQEDDMPTMDEIIEGLNTAAKAGKLDAFFKRQRSLIETGVLEDVHAIVKATDKRIANDG